LKRFRPAPSFNRAAHDALREGSTVPMQLHEVHPSVIHAPLALLPAAAVIDVLAASRGRPLRRFALDRAGRRLWWLGVGSAAFAGLAGMAASQEVHLEDPRARDAMWLHGMGNTLILLAAAGLAGWRSGHRATPVTAGIGAAAVGAALYTAWLGGALVYTHGAGVTALVGESASLRRSPRLLSLSAPVAFVRDAAKGLAWLLSRGTRVATRREPLAPGAATEASDLRPLRRHAGERPRALQ
jgi:uncharacterized membrane protein